jgi:hypothetical protein
VSRGETPGLRVRRRLAQISDRLDELRARSHEISGLSASPGSERERLAHAANCASQARAHAVEAARLATTAYLRSADVHERVADLYDHLAVTRAGDVTRYVEQSDRHRTLAANDRAAAQRNNAA